MSRAVAQLRAARADVTTLARHLDGLLEAAANEETASRVVELVEVLALRARALTPDEALVIDGLLTVAEAATFGGWSESFVRGLLERGALRAVRVGDTVRIPRLAVVRLAAQALDAPRAAAGGGR